MFLVDPGRHWPGVRVAFVADPQGHLIEMLDRPGPPGAVAEAG